MYTCISGTLSDFMLITTPPWVCAWPWSEWPWPLAATVSWELGPKFQICFMVSAMSETDFGWSTAIGWDWYLLPKSLATCLRSASSKLKCPFKGSALSEEGMLEIQKLSLMVKQLRNKIMRPLMKRMLYSLRRLNDGYLIFLYEDMLVVEGWTTKGEHKQKGKWWSDEVKKEERVEAEFIEVCRWLSQSFSYENPYEDWLLGRIPFGSPFWTSLFKRETEAIILMPTWRGKVTTKRDLTNLPTFPNSSYHNPIFPLRTDMFQILWSLTNLSMLYFFSHLGKWNKERKKKVLSFVFHTARLLVRPCSCLPHYVGVVVIVVVVNPLLSECKHRVSLLLNWMRRTCRVVLIHSRGRYDTGGAFVGPCDTWSLIHFVLLINHVGSRDSSLALLCRPSYWKNNKWKQWKTATNILMQCCTTTTAILLLMLFRIFSTKLSDKFLVVLLSIPSFCYIWRPLNYSTTCCTLVPFYPFPLQVVFLVQSQILQLLRGIHRWASHPQPLHKFVTSLDWKNLHS